MYRGPDVDMYMIYVYLNCVWLHIYIEESHMSAEICC